jgi:hypothetical protein
MICIRNLLSVPNVVVVAKIIFSNIKTTTATVTWETPAGKVGNYVVTVDQGGTAAAVTAGKVNTALSNLKPGTEHAVSIKSIIGSGNGAAVSSAVTKKIKTRKTNFLSLCIQNHSHLSCPKPSHNQSENYE